MAPWQAYGHRHVHGIGLETAQGHADIEGGYADQHLRVTVQVGAQPAQHRRVATMAQAQAWAEAQLRAPPQSSHASGMQMLGRGGRHPARGRFFERNILYENEEHNRARLVSRRTGTHVYEGCC